MRDPRRQGRLVRVRRGVGILNMGNRVSVRSGDGEPLAEFGGAQQGLEPDQFAAPHAIAIDSSGDVYVAEVTGVVYQAVGIDLGPFVEPVSMRKWRRSDASVPTDGAAAIV
jgi:hypothetical protein